MSLIIQNDTIKTLTEFQNLEILIYMKTSTMKTYNSV